MNDRKFKKSLANPNSYGNRKAAKKAAKQDAKREKKELRKTYPGWFKVTGQAICGCCEAVLYYETRARAEAACKKVTNKHALMVDDAGNEEMVDGFYGFTVEQV